MDKVENLHDSLVQHGPLSDRIYLMRYSESDPEDIIASLNDLAYRAGYGKIIAKIPAVSWRAFKDDGYEIEAVIPDFFKGFIDSYFVSKFPDEKRGVNQSRYKTVPKITEDGTLTKPKPQQTAPQSKVEKCTPSDAEEISSVFRRVFESYPFPVHRPQYIQKMMAQDVDYFCIRSNGEIVATAASERDPKYQAAEMTDFATLPGCRAKGFANALLLNMEKRAKTRGILTAYAIARERSVGMNTVFKRSGYNHAGVLINNTNICGSIQNMVVWYKKLNAP